MIVRRGQVAARLGAGLILAAACAVGPLGVYAAATPPSIIEKQGGADCTPGQASASPSSVEVGESVQISGTCFTPRKSAKITVISPNGSKTFTPDPGGEGSFSISYTAQVAGDYTFLIDVDGQQASGAFTVAEAAPPTEEPTPDPTTPPTEEPTPDPTTPPTEKPTTDPTDDPTDDSTGDPTTPPPATDDPATDDPGTGTGTGTGTGEQAPPTSTGPSESASPTAPRPSDDEDSEPGTDQSGTAPTTDAGQQTDGQQSDGQPTAASTTPADGKPTAAEQTPSSPAATAPGTATNDFPATAPEYTAEQRKTGATAALMTSLFAHGVSGGQVGISPAEADARISAGTPGGERDASGSGRSNASDGGGELAGDPSASDAGSEGTSHGSSDGGGELAETGTEVSIAAAGAGIALLGGAGLLSHSRRRD